METEFYHFTRHMRKRYIITIKESFVSDYLFLICRGMPSEMMKFSFHFPGFVGLARKEAVHSLKIYFPMVEDTGRGHADLDLLATPMFKNSSFIWKSFAYYQK